MSNKVLVVGEFKRGGLNPVAIGFFSAALFLFLVCYSVAWYFGESLMWAFEGIAEGYIIYLFFHMAIIGSTVAGFVYMYKVATLVVSEDAVSGITVFKKRVDLPISQIAAIGSGRFGRVSISTASGIISFYCLTNQQQMFECISNLIKKRQNQTSLSNVCSPTSSSSLDDLQKLKSLLDQGIISPEEFESKKKQILDL